MGKRLFDQNLDHILSLHRKTAKGRLAERLGNGLQNRVKQFDSATDL